MPTDPNNLKDGQPFAVRYVVDLAADPDFRSYVPCKDNSETVCFIHRGDIITDWPPEPSADEAGWEVFCGLKPNTWIPTGPLDYSKYEYRVQRRPFAPKWVPTVGEDARTNKGDLATVLFVGERVSVVVNRIGCEYSIFTRDLTQPKEQPHED